MAFTDGEALPTEWHQKVLLLILGISAVLTPIALSSNSANATSSPIDIYKSP